MIKLNLLLLVAMAFCLGLPAGPAQAQLARTWVSSLGDNGNDCNRLTPCRTFQRAHDQTLPLGEITVLDAGGYGAVTITKGISIINDGVGEAGVLVSGGFNGITINAGASDAVTLRGLTVKGIGFGGGQGIVFNSGAALTVENCTIRNLDGGSTIGNGIVFKPAAAAALAVTNTAVTDNDFAGIFIASAGAGRVRAVLDRVGLYNNLKGLDVNSATGSAGTVDVAVIDSIASGNAGIGYSATADTGHASILLVLQRSAATGNGTGVYANGAVAQVIVDRSTITRNGNGWAIGANGQIFSYSNNVVAANTALEGNMPTFTPR